MKLIAMALITTGIAFLAPACGGDDGGGAGSSASSGLQAALHASCDKAFECKDSYDAAMNNDNSFESQFGTSTSNCYDMYVALIQQFLGADYFEQVDASVAAGRIVYSPSDENVCLDAEAAVSCDAFFGQNGATADEPPECDSAFEGTVATGGMCTTDFDCMVDGDTCTDNVCTAG